MDTGEANLRYINNNESGPGTLYVEAPAGEVIKYVTIHDTGNYWSVDNIIVDTALEFTKVSDANSCVSPVDELTYTILYHNRTDETFYDAYVIDYFPDGVDFPAGADSYMFDGNSIQTIEGDSYYDQATHSYFWNIGDITPGDVNAIDLEVTVSNSAEPGLKLHNVADLWATVMVPDPNDPNNLVYDTRMIARATEDTPVCCWGDDPNLVYVDWTAEGYNNGTDWDNAYTDLADALRRATDSNCPGPYTIYVAQGIYDPNNTPELTFALPEGCWIYGGFPAGGCDFAYRNPRKYETILTGDFDNDGFPDVDSVVTMGDETLLDGFTVRDASAEGYGIYGNSVDFAIENCTVENNNQYGIYAKNGNVTVKWCKILLNDSDGIYHEGSENTLSVDNCWLLRNGEVGINCDESTPTVKNSIVSESDLKEAGLAGIRILNPTGQPKLHNLTISNNKAEGIYFEHTDPNYFNEENSANRIEIQNCIVYFNNDNGPQLSPQLDLNLDRVAHYSCIADCNSVNNNTSDAPLFAYRIDPNGVPDPNNHHLHSNDIVCQDKGNNVSLDYTGHADMDNDGRVTNSRVDIGADEVDCEDVSHPLDWDADGLVNLYEFSSFQRAWLSHDPSDPALTDPNYPMHGPYNDVNSIYYVSDSMKDNWNPVCDLEPTGASQYVIDLEDLAIFWWDDENNRQNWLWKACWKDDGLYETMGMSGGGESMMMAVPMTTTEFTSISEPLQIPEPTIEEQILALEDCIELLEKLWLEEPGIQQEIDPETWKEFMDSVYLGLQELQNLKAESIQIE